MKIFLITLCMFVSLIPCSFSAQKLWDCSSAVTTIWQLRPGDMNNEIVENAGRKQWLLTFPKATKKEEYPALISRELFLQFSEQHKFLTVKLSVPESEGSFEFNIRIKGAKHYARYTLQANVGSNIYNIAIEDILKKLSGDAPLEFILYMAKPPASRTLMLESIYLRDSPGELFAQQTGLEKVIFSPNWRDASRIWKGRPSTLIGTLEAWPDGVPGIALKVQYPKGDIQERYPALIASQSAAGDWSPFDKINLELYSMEKDTFQLKAMVRTSAKDARFTFNIRPGRQTIAIDVPAIAEQTGERTVRELHLYMVNPQKKINFMIGRAVLSTHSTEERGIRLRRLQEQTDALFSIPLELKDKIRSIDLNSRRFEAEFQELKSQIASWLTAERMKVYMSAATADGIAWTMLPPTSIIKPCGENITVKPCNIYKIFAARGEYEGAILALITKDDMTGVVPEITDLISREGNKLSADNISIAPVGFIKCQATPYAPFQKDEYFPDPIMEHLHEFKLIAKRFVSCFLDVAIPETQLPGDYYGQVILRLPSGKAIHIPLEVKVWDFSINNNMELFVAVSQREPYQPQSLSGVYLETEEEQLQYMDYFASGGQGSLPGSERLQNAISARKSLDEVLLRHRLSPDCLYRRSPPRITSTNANTTMLPLNFAYATEKTPQLLEEYIKANPDAKLAERFYLYGFDEAYEKEFQRMKKILTQCKRIAPALMTITTAYDLSFGVTTGLDGLVDFWIVPLDQYIAHMENIHVARNRNNIRIGHYTACGPFAPYPNFFLEYSRVGQRLLTGFTAYSLKSDGFLYYSIYQFRHLERDSSGKWGYGDFQKPLNNEIFTDFHAATYRDFNGDGNMVYPGPDRILPGLRLKAFRDGLEDYIYSAKLKNINSDKSKKLLQEIEIISIPPFREDDGAMALFELRQRIGDYIEHAKITRGL